MCCFSFFVFGTFLKTDISKGVDVWEGRAGGGGTERTTEKGVMGVGEGSFRGGGTTGGRGGRGGAGNNSSAVKSLLGLTVRFFHSWIFSHLVFFKNRCVNCVFTHVVKTKPQRKAVAKNLAILSLLGLLRFLSILCRRV